MAERAERDYVLGTHEAEIARLGVQHRAWLPYAAACWNTAGIRQGSRVIDVGAGPGYASFDLAELVGPSGWIAAVERSSSFSEAIETGTRERGLSNISIHQLDLMHDPLPEGPFDASWCRWVCSFIESPERLVAQLARAVRPGGVALFHEYVDYASWRFFPRLPLIEEYIGRVMESWRAAGGEPDVAMRLLPLLERRGFEVRQTTPLLFCVQPGHPMWAWISTFVRGNLDRLVATRAAEATWTEAVREELLKAEAIPTRLLTPAVLEIVAVRLGDMP